MFAKYRKAFAAAITVLVGLPLADWAGGGQPFSWGTLLQALIGAVATGGTVARVPNTP